MYMKLGINIPEKGFTESDCILKIDGLLTIPFHEENSDYKEYLAWLNDGNTPIDYDNSILN